MGKGTEVVKGQSAWIGFFKFMAWVNVVMSFVAFYFILIEYSTEIILSGIYYTVEEEITNWPAIGLGIGLIVESLTVLAFTMVICRVAECMLERETMLQFSTTDER